MSDGLYVYCIIRSNGEKNSFGNIGFGGNEVYTIDYKDFSPVISNAPIKKYEVNEDEVELHKNIVQLIMNEHSVIPVAYGMVFKNRKLITIAMSAGYKAIKKAMESIDNKIELGIKVIMPKDAGLNGKKEECRSEYLERLKKLAHDSKELKLFSERLVLNVSFLVAKDKINEFSGEVENLSNKYDYLKTQYSGPWPPYNFVDIHVLSKKKGGFR
jgi:hypothetical protein